ncbi:ubiquitin-protein ligase E3B-like [Uloborus diversus]|uniref:ubiquitin-protein ligase E3B-like n=1 Tax=Uloborus diversus TaxID=327109 RepID=UPI00240911D6|nr:ubiquitin-protein ligase E3B-like [Uloborus diversus]
MFEISNVSSKDQFLEQAKAARLERAQERKKEQAAITIQSYARGYFARQKLKHDVWKEFDEIFMVFNESNKLPLALDVYKIIRRLMFLINEDTNDKERFEKLCKYIIASIDSDSLKKSYIAVAFNKELAVAWIHHLKTLLWQCCVYLKSLKPERPQDSKSMMLYLHMLVTFTSTGTWKVLNNKQGEALKPAMNQLCANIMGHLVTKGLYSVLQGVLLKGLVRVKPCLKRATLLAITNLSVRPVVSSQFSNNLMNLFLLHVMSVPALMLHFHNSASECLIILSNHEIFKHALDLLVSEQNTRILFNALEGNYALCLIANLIHMGHSDLENLQTNLLDFINVITRIMESCQKYVVNKQSNLTHWHPVLGWFAQKIDLGLHESLSLVKKQIQLLWSGPMITAIFSHLVDSVLAAPQPSSPTSNQTVTSPVQSSPFKTSIFKKALEKASSSRLATVRYKRLGSPETTLVALTCNLYETALATLTQMKLDILTGLCYQDMVLPNLWKFISSLGPGNGLKAFLDHLAVTTKTCSPEFQILVLFCDCATHLITILDDVELYEQQKPFCLDDLVSISSFLNQLVFKLIWNNLIVSY